MGELILHQPSCDLAMMRAYAASGWRSVLIDLEHGFFSEADVLTALTGLSAGNAALYLKMPNLAPAGYARFLDMGVRRFVLPHVEDPAELRAIRTALAEIFWVDQETVELYPLIESRAAIERIADLCAETGVAGAMLGPGDLARDLGLPIRRVEDYAVIGPQLLPHLGRALRAIRATGKRSGCMVMRCWFDDFPFEDCDLVTLSLTDVAAAQSVAPR